MAPHSRITNISPASGLARINSREPCLTRCVQDRQDAGKGCHERKQFDAHQRESVGSEHRQRVAVRLARFRRHIVQKLVGRGVTLCRRTGDALARPNLLIGADQCLLGNAATGADFRATADHCLGADERTGSDPVGAT